MNRDAHYLQIVQRLDGQLDPATFELAVVDLLREAYPGLASVAGGSDSGFDGAIADGIGEPIPLITTTARDALGNLTRNLRQYVADGGSRRKAAFATSRALTPRRRQNLLKRARELGFTLIGIHDQQDIAARLYGSPRWYRELLGVTGHAPALSKVARGVRPFSDRPIVGRGSTLDWLSRLETDALLVGQPGSGKTFLLQRQVIDGNFGLFAVSSNRDALVEGIREQQPSLVIVDDAHFQQELLTDLQHLRRDLGAEFKILATSWPGEASQIESLLQVGSSARHELQLLTRDEIVQVVHGIGLFGPIDLVAEIVNQAEGRPGLAVMLAHACIVQSVSEVVTGAALRNQVLRPFDRPGHSSIKQLLAGLSLGWDTGLAFDVVADALGVPMVDAQNALVSLAAGGVIFDRGAGLSVRPPALRHVLVRDVFFSGRLSLPTAVFNAIAEHADTRDVAMAVLGARARDGDVPLEVASDYARRAGLFKEFAWTGSDAVRWLLAHSPERVVDYAEAALKVEPPAAMRLLLAEAVGNEKPLHSQPRHPLRLIGDWIKGTPDAEQSLSRRRALHSLIANWASEGVDFGVAARCIPMVYELEFDFATADPGAGMTIHLYRGPFASELYEELSALWPATVDAFANDELKNWHPLIQVMEEWFLGRLNHDSQEVASRVAELGLGMLDILSAAAVDHPGVLQRLRRILYYRGQHDRLPPNKVYEALFPIERYRDLADPLDPGEVRNSTEVLALQWVNEKSPEEIVEALGLVAQEQDRSGLGYPNFLPRFWSSLAEASPEPQAVAAALMSSGSNPHTVLPFLDQAVRHPTDAGIEVLTHSLSSAEYVAPGILVSLTNPLVPSALMRAALSTIGDMPNLAESVVRSRETTEQVLLALLDHESAAVVQHAMEALGHRYLADEMAGTIRSAWEAAFIRSARADDDWLVQRVLERSPHLAEHWLKALLAEPDPRLYRYENALREATGSLSPEARLELLSAVPRAGLHRELVPLLVGDDVDLYRQVLGREDLGHAHLIPLETSEPIEAWVAKAIAAIQSGYSPETVARRLMSGPWEWVGSEADYWERKLEYVLPLVEHEDEVIRRVGRIVHDSFARNRDRAREDEREEAVFGWPLRLRS